MGFPENLIARAGDLIQDKWILLQAWANQQELRRGSPDVRLTVTDNGTFINVETRKRLRHPFAVAISGATATIRPGTLNGDSPRIGEVRINGLAMDYAPAATPSLPIENPPRTGLSQIALQVTLNEANEIDPEDPEALQIVHHVPSNLPAFAPSHQTGLQPLMNLYWNGGRLERSLQIVHHNLQHAFQPGEGERPGNHYFWAV